MEALDWTIGEHRFHKILGWNPLYNSFYAGTPVGQEGSSVSGTTFGVIKMDGTDSTGAGRVPCPFISSDELFLPP